MESVFRLVIGYLNPLVSRKVKLKFKAGSLDVNKLMPLAQSTRDGQIRNGVSRSTSDGNSTAQFATTLSESDKQTQILNSCIYLKS